MTRRRDAVINGLVRGAQRDEIALKICAAGPRAVYAALLYHAQIKNHDLGWAKHAFREVFGGWPRPRGRVAPAPLPDQLLIETWTKLYKKRKAKGNRESQDHSEPPRL
jgi:hypothetical protein